METQPLSKDLKTVSEIARVLSVSPKTIYQWAVMRRIPCYKLCGCLRFDLDEVLKWVKTCKKEPLSNYNPIGRGPGKEVRNEEVAKGAK